MFSLVLLFVLKGKFKTEVTEIVELENEKEIPHKEGKEDFILTIDLASQQLVPIFIVGYYADVKFKINGFLKTVKNMHSYSKIYIGRKLQITYFIFFKFKINCGEELLT